jgi:hypothetical protein
MTMANDQQGHDGPGQQISGPTVSPQGQQFSVSHFKRRLSLLASQAAPLPPAQQMMFWLRRRCMPRQSSSSGHTSDVYQQQTPVPSSEGHNSYHAPSASSACETQSGHLHGCWWWCGSGVVDGSDNEDAGKQQCWCYPFFLLLLPLPCMIPCYQGVCSRGILVNTFFSFPDIGCSLACHHQGPAQVPVPRLAPRTPLPVREDAPQLISISVPRPRPRADCLSVW